MHIYSVAQMIGRISTSRFCELKYSQSSFQDSGIPDPRERLSRELAYQISGFL